MNNFKAGDRVIYEATSATRTRELEGLTGTVVMVEAGLRGVRVAWDRGIRSHPVLPGNLRLIDAPDVITIDRSTLPKVSADYEASDFPGKDVPRIALAVLLAGGWSDADDAVRSLRSTIAGYAESIVGDKRADRRNELAEMFAPGVGWGRLSPDAKRTIDHIIALGGIVAMEDKK